MENISKVGSRFKSKEYNNLGYWQKTIDDLMGCLSTGQMLARITTAIFEVYDETSNSGDKQKLIDDFKREMKVRKIKF